MDDSHSLATLHRHEVSIFFNAEKFVHAQRVANVFAASNLVPDHLKNKMGDCLIALDIAEQMNENPLMVMQNIYVVHGRPGWSAAYMIARANRSGIFSGPLRWHINGEGDSLAVTCYADLANPASDEDRRVEITVDMKMAKADGWTKNDKYRSMPEQMLRWRSATWLIRTTCPEVMMGIPAADELEDINAASRWVDVTPPRPVLEEFTNPAAVVDEAGKPPATTTPLSSPGEPPKRQRRKAAQASDPRDPDPPPDHPEGDEGEEAPAPVTEPVTPPPPDPPPPQPAAANANAGGIHVGPYDVLVPGGEQIQSWFQPAKSKLAEMEKAGCAPEDFVRFREVNAGPLGKMHDGFGFWFSSLDAIIRKGEGKT